METKGVALNDLNELSKEELIDKIKSLHSHNVQLKNILAKSSGTKSKSLSRKQQKPFDFSRCNFRHVLLKILYIGWDYQGYATQEDTLNTIEHHLFEALQKTCLIKDRSTSNYHRCGRTDKGVSSFGQVISITLRSKQNEENEELDYCTMLNNVLPDTIRCLAWCPVDSDFSARFNCKSRTYKYFFPKGSLNIEKMQLASRYLLGTHDFRNFCKMDVGNGVVMFVRNILLIEIAPINVTVSGDEYDYYVITIKGQAFLWHQIRCIMGVLFLIGQEREPPEILLELLDVEKNPRKPDYNMASEVPLNLYCCDYDDVQWKYDRTSLESTMQKLQTMWTFTSVKSVMLKHMLKDMQKQNVAGDAKGGDFSSCLLYGVKARKYIPLLQRKKCESLENRIEHYAKRQKVEAFTNPALMEDLS